MLCCDVFAHPLARFRVNSCHMERVPESFHYQCCLISILKWLWPIPTGLWGYWGHSIRISFRFFFSFLKKFFLIFFFFSILFSILFSTYSNLLCRFFFSFEKPHFSILTRSSWQSIIDWLNVYYTWKFLRLNESLRENDVFFCNGKSFNMRKKSSDLFFSDFLFLKTIFEHVGQQLELLDRVLEMTRW